MPDRRVHAALGEEQIVRYDREGKWFIEYEPNRMRMSRRITLSQAVLRAKEMVKMGGDVYLDLPGGLRFDAMYRKKTDG